jgi:hypothetical protein
VGLGGGEGAAAGGEHLGSPSKVACSQSWAAARAGEPDLQAFAATIDRERLAGATALAAHLAERGALLPNPA